jgi:hypothetical protein
MLVIGSASFKMSSRIRPKLLKPQNSHSTGVTAFFADFTPFWGLEGLKRTPSIL